METNIQINNFGGIFMSERIIDLYDELFGRLGGMVDDESFSKNQNRLIRKSIKILKRSCKLFRKVLK